MSIWTTMRSASAMVDDKELLLEGDYLTIGRELFELKDVPALRDALTELLDIVGHPSGPAATPALRRGEEITSTDQLDALPDGAAIKDRDGDTWIKRGDTWKARGLGERPGERLLIAFPPITFVSTPGGHHA